MILAGVARENVEVVRRFYEAVNARDEAGLEPLLAPDFEGRSLFTNVEGEIYRGMDGVRTYLRDAAEVWSHYELVIEELIDVADDRVLALLQVDARGVASGAVIDLEGAAVFTLRDGQIHRVYVYETRAAARAAVGLED